MSSSTKPTLERIPLSFSYTAINEPTSSSPSYLISLDHKDPNTLTFTSSPNFNQAEFDRHMEVIENLLPAALAATEKSGWSEEEVVGFGVVYALKQLQTEYNFPAATLTVAPRRVEWTAEMDEQARRMTEKSEEGRQLLADLKASREKLDSLAFTVAQLTAAKRKEEKWQKGLASLYDTPMDPSRHESSAGGTARTEDQDENFMDLLLEEMARAFGATAISKTGTATGTPTAGSGQGAEAKRARAAKAKATLASLH